MLADSQSQAISLAATHDRSHNHRLFIPDGEGGFIDDNLLWAAGSLRESPQGADGGFVATPEDATLDPYRSQHGPCQVVFRR